MRSPLLALTWDIWARNRTLVWWLCGLVVFSCVFNSVLPDVRVSKPDNGLVNFHVAAATLLLVLAIFGYTEFNPQKGSTGFPRRLFVLPVSTFKLVALPTILGLAAVEIIALLWTRFLLSADERSIWIPIQLGVYMVLYQTILWTLSNLKSVRLLILGLVGVVAILARAFPSVRQLPDSTYLGLLVSVAFAAFLISWAFVARERSGGGWIRLMPRVRVARASAQNPKPRPPFSSPAAAQFWLEWRRSGFLLPLIVGLLLGFVIVPLSWYLRDGGSHTLSILVATLAMPMVLALALGKAFSKPDFWSKDLTIPGFLAVKPLDTFDMVATKLRVAALSTAISWGLVLAFLSLWLPFWANLDSVAMIRGIVWMMHGHALYPQYAIAGFGFVACMLLTWRFLVGGLWLGLSGNARVFGLSAVPYGVGAFLGVPAVAISIEFHESILDWIYDNTDWLPVLVWVAAAALVMKFWVAAVSWRTINPKYVRRYLTIWAGCSVCLIAIALLLGDLLSIVFPVDAYRVRSLMILLALQVIPLARLGVAPLFLSRSRHR